MQNRKDKNLFKTVFLVSFMRKVKRQKKKVENKIVNRVKTGEVILLLALILLLISINYPFLDEKIENFLTEGRTAQINVERVIDGDTVVSSSGEHVRLLGINTPEKGEFLYEGAKGFLETLVLNKTVILEFTKAKYDKYNRTLAYIFLGGENVNVQLVKNGFANYYFYDGLDKYSIELKDAWQSCINDKINLCEPSTSACASCFSIESSKSYIINNCDFSCDISAWQMKGEGREKFIFSEQTIQPKSISRFALDLTNTGGTLFLRDEEGKLVAWEE